MARTLELYRWRLTDPWSDRRTTTSYVMTQADARSLDPRAEPVEGSLERRLVPDDWREMSTSAWQSRGGPDDHRGLPPAQPGSRYSESRLPPNVTIVTAPPPTRPAHGLSPRRP
jgi:hypothetical protein